MIWEQPTTPGQRKAWLRRRRYPLCPGCHHNLLATLMEGLRRCPECGEEFDPAEIKTGWAADDWTDRSGWEKAAVEFAWRETVAIALWVGALRIATWVVEHDWGLPVESFGLGIVVGFGLMFVAGLMLGKLMSWRLAERIGATGRMLIVLAAASCVLAIVAGTFVAQVYWPTEILVVSVFDLIGVAVGPAAAARSLVDQD